VIVAGDRLFFDGEEYVLMANGELKLARSDKELLEKVERIRARLGI
jgi:hypothetical protein